MWPLPGSASSHAPRTIASASWSALNGLQRCFSSARYMLSTWIPAPAASTSPAPLPPSAFRSTFAMEKYTCRVTLFPTSARSRDCVHSRSARTDAASDPRSSASGVQSGLSLNRFSNPLAQRVACSSHATAWTTNRHRI